MIADRNILIVFGKDNQANGELKYGVLWQGQSGMMIEGVPNSVWSRILSWRNREFWDLQDSFSPFSL